MQRSQAAQATDPRDKIYALLGLTYDGDDLVPYPNYRQSIGEVLGDFTRTMMKSKRSLDYLFFTSSGQALIEDMPTWALDWVGLWSDPGDLYLFDQKIIPGSKFKPTDSSGGNLLRTRGDILCTIERFPRVARGRGLRHARIRYSQNSIQLCQAICASLCLGNVPELNPASQLSQTTFFSSLWDTNGRLGPEKHVEILHHLREPFTLIQHLSLGSSTRSYISQSLPQSGLENQRDREMALITVKMTCIPLLCTIDRGVSAWWAMCNTVVATSRVLQFRVRSWFHRFYTLYHAVSILFLYVSLET
jgi:hypothetical protein